MSSSVSDKEPSNLKQKNHKSSLSMQCRLFVYLILFIFAIASGVFVILLLTGTLKTGEYKAKLVFESELEDIADHIYNNFGNISVQGIDLSNSLSISLEAKMKDLGINVHNFKNYPQHLEKLLADQFDKLTGYLEKSKTSGVFLMLDATVNKNLNDSEYSRSGLYIRNMEPNVVNNSFSNFRFLHGPMSLAFKNDMYILPQWKMEINTKNAAYFNTVMNNARGSNLPLSRLYYWTEPVNFINDNGDLMLCIVPLISKDKTVFGLCGFEVSSMLFKLAYSPNNSSYNYLISMLSKIKNNEIDTKTAFFADKYLYDYTKLTNESLVINLNAKFLNTYRQTYGKENFIGLHKSIKLYPSDSIYMSDNYAVSILIPEKSFSLVFSNQNSSLIFYFGVLMILSIVIGYFISKRHMKPLVNTLGLLRTVNPSDVPKINISEIDDLIEFLSKQDEEEKIEDKRSSSIVINENNNSSLFTEFIKNIESLSMAEKAVFNLYLKGNTAKEIADILCLSINTIKTHNKRIYMKLNVSSRKELMVYIKMMEEKGMIEEIKN